MSPRADDLGSSNLVDLQTSPPDNAEPSVSVRLHRSGRWTVIVVTGEMDIQVVPLVPALPDDDAGHVVFKLQGVTFMDAGGLGAILGSKRKALHVGGCVRLVAPSSQARRLLTLTGTDHVFGTFSSLHEAVSAPVHIGPQRAS